MNFVKGVFGVVAHEFPVYARVALQAEAKKTTNRLVGYEGQTTITISAKKAEILSIENFNRKILEATSNVLRKQ